MNLRSKALLKFKSLPFPSPLQVLLQPCLYHHVQGGLILTVSMVLTQLYNYIAYITI